MVLIKTVPTWLITISPGQPSLAPIGPQQVGIDPPDGMVPPGLGAGSGPLQAKTAKFGGHVIVGGVTSNFLVIICVQVAELPHASVAR